MKKIKKIVRNRRNKKYKEISNKKENYQYLKIRKTYSETNLLIEKRKSEKLSTKSKINKYRLTIILFLTIIIILFIILIAINFRNNLIVYKNNLIVYKNNENVDNNNENVDNNNENVDKDANIICDNETIYYEEKFDSYIEAFNKSKDFINNNLKGILLNSKKINLSKKPKITVVIPCYNCKNYILSCVRSIQNQNFYNFEIIIADDASNNDTILYLEKLQKEEQRIKIIRNKNNMGTLYTRSIGTLSSDGKYIFTMDSDDMYLDENVLSSIINIAYKCNFDIIIFNSICTDLKPDVDTTKISICLLELNHKPNLVLFQPNLGYYPITPTNNIGATSGNEVLIRPKCIKTKIYKEALNKLGEERYSRHMLLGEDDMANYIIFNTAQVAKFVPRYGYLYINNQGSISKTEKDMAKLTTYFIYIYDAMIDFSLNLANNKKVLVNYIIFILENKYLKNALTSNEYNNKLFISCLDRVFNCSLISDEYIVIAIHLEMYFIFFEIFG